MRAGNETGSENAPVPAFASPLPSVTEPFQSTSTCRSKVATVFLSLPSASNSHLHRHSHQSDHDPDNGNPALSRRGCRIKNPDVAAGGGACGLPIAGHH